MRGLSSRLLVLALVVALLGVAAPATAGTGGKWDRFTPQDQSSIDHASLQRASDGRLHAVWKRRSSPNTDELLHRVVSPTGTVGASSVVQSGWASITGPGLILDGSVLRVFFGGIYSNEDQRDFLNTATAPSSGSPWTLAPGPVAEGNLTRGADFAATVGPDGSPFQTWTPSTGVFVHRGLSPGEIFDYGGRFGAACTCYQSNLAVDGGSGQMWLAWFSQTQDNVGVYVNQVNTSTGAPAGPPMRMPGSSTVFQGTRYSINMGARTPIVGRPGRPGVFVAYPAGYPQTDTILVWRIGTSSPAVVARGARVDDAALATDPRGRVWVLWSRSAADGTPQVFARRSNPSVTTWGRTTRVRGPGRAVAIFNVAADAQPRRVDVVGLFGTVNNEIANWHTQLKPALTLAAQPRRFAGKRTVTFRVRDAGVPVSNALVKVAGKSKRTNDNGVARITVGPYAKTQRIAAVATRAGFVRHRIVLRVRPA